MARTDTLGHFLTDVADAIREKKGTSDTIQASEFDTEIENLPSGADLSEYFITEITQTSDYPISPLKKFPDIVVSDNITSLQSAFSMVDFSNMPAPKVIANDNITSLGWIYFKAVNCLSIDMTGVNASNVTTMQGAFSNGTDIEGRLSSVNFGNNFDTKKVISMRDLFLNRTGLTSLDLSSFETPALTGTRQMFDGCISLTFLDIRKMTFGNVSETLNMFRNVPASCEIIVKTQTEKDWVLSVRSNLTNVKTVAEYEAEQSE